MSSEKSLTPQIRFKGFTEAWEQRKLGELGQTYNGLTGKNKDDFGHGRAQYITYMNVFSNPICDLALTEKIEVDQKQNEVEIGDVFFTTSSETPEEVGMSSVLTEKQGITYLNSFCFGYRPLKKIDLNYLAYMLRSNTFRKNITFLAQGISRYNISKTKVMDVSMHLPTTKEQYMVGTFFKNLDSLITLHQRKLDALKKIKSALLEKMFPKDGSNIPEIRFAGYTETWEQRKLGELMEVTSVRRVHQDEWTTQGVRFLRARDLVAYANNIEIELPLYISKELYEKYTAQSGKVEIGDLLVTGVGTIGVPWLVETPSPVYFKDGNIIWFKNKNAIYGKYFYYAFTSSFIQNFIKESAGTGTVGTYTIDTGKKTPIYIPSTFEQHKIASAMKRFDSLITLHQRKLDALKKIKSALLEKMFV